jgi:hypothetical protein
MASPRAKTTEEIIEELMSGFRDIATYWSKQEQLTVAERTSGAVFGVLTLLDGCTGEFPAFDLVARPHEQDKQYCIDNGIDWYEPGTVISTMLHEHFHQNRPDGESVSRDPVVRLLKAAKGLLENLQDSGDAYVDEDHDLDDVDHDGAEPYPVDQDGDVWYHDAWELHQAIQAVESLSKFCRKSDQ